MTDYFALGDTNKDGYIDCDEFRAISATFDIPVTKADVHFKIENTMKASVDLSSLNFFVELPLYLLSQKFIT